MEQSLTFADQSLEGFFLTHDSLLSRIVEKRRKVLEASMEYNLSWIIESSDWKLLDIVSCWINHSKSSAPIALAEFPKKLSNYKTYKSGRTDTIEESCSVPIAIQNPKVTKILFGILLLVFVIPLGITGIGFGNIVCLMGFVGMFILFSVILFKTLRHRNHDLKMAVEIREAVNQKLLEINDRVAEFEEQLETDDVLFLGQIIQELESQSEIHTQEKNKVLLKLAELVTEPRKDVEKQISTIKDQLNCIYKLKNDLALEDYEEKKALLSKRRVELKNSLEDFPVLEKAIQTELSKFNKISSDLDRTIQEIRKQRTRLMNKTQLAKAINHSLGNDSAIDMDYMQRSRYHRELTESLNKLASLNESLHQILVAGNQACKQIPESWRSLQLVA